MRDILFAIFFCLILPVKGQEVNLSLPQKLPRSMPGLELLGSNKEAYLLHRYGRGDHLIEFYDYQMRLKNKKEIPVPRGATLRKILVLPDHFVILYRLRERDHEKLYLQKFDAALKPLHQKILIDSSDRKHYGIYGIEPFQNGRKVVVYGLQGEGKGRNVYVGKIDTDSMKVLQTDHLFLKVEDRSAYLKKAGADTLGNMIFVFTGEVEKEAGEPVYNEFQVFTYFQASRELQQHSLKGDDKIFWSSKVGMDLVNNQIIFAGFYSSDEARNPEGSFYMTINVGSFKANEVHFNPFAINIEKNTGELLRTFRAKDLLIKYNGGAILVAESFYKEMRSYSYSGRWDPFGRPMLEERNMLYYYNDILAVSISPEGSVEWERIIPKKQVSEDDGGAYSSYAILAFKNQLNLIYNEEVVRNPKLIDAVISANGEKDKKTIYDKYERRMMPVPRSGKQVSYNEIIIPVRGRNYYQLIKFTY